MTNDKDQKAFQELDAWLDDNRVTEVECLVPDLTGMARGKILPRVKFQEERGMKLPEAVLGMTVTGGFPEDGPYYDVINEIDVDLFLKPDPSTARVVPWAIDPTAVVIHDCFNAEGKIVDFAPRSVLRRVLKLYADEGWSPVVAPELEFYLVARNTDPNEPLRPPIGRSGRAEAGRQAYSIDSVNEFDPLFEDIYDYCEKQKLDIDTLMILSAVSKVAVDYGTPRQRDLNVVTVSEMKALHAQGQFPPGSMGPKVDAAIRFIEIGGKRCIIGGMVGFVGHLTVADGTIVTTCRRKRVVVESIAAAGYDYAHGLEAGSKPELAAVLGLAPPGSIMPIASVHKAMVLAVPMTMQVPAVGASFSFTSLISC